MDRDNTKSKYGTDQRLSLAHRELYELPQQVVSKFALITRELDLSGNNISDLHPLREFVNLEVLILDGNRVTSHTIIPALPNVHTFWINKNKIDNLAVFLDKVVQVCPNVKYFSMMQNDACPNYFNGGTPSQYQDYRYYVLSRLRNLVHLDDSKVTEEEKQAAVRKYGNLESLVARDEQEKRELEEKRRQQQEEKRKQKELEAKRRAQEEKERRRAKRRQKRAQDPSTAASDLPNLPPVPGATKSTSTTVASPPPPPPLPEPQDSVGLMGELAKRLGKLQLPEFNEGASGSKPATPSRSSANLDDEYKWSSSDDEGDWTDDDDNDRAK